MREVSREWLEFLREQYPKGSRVRLTKMGNDPHPIPPGSMGTLKYIDDVGQFHVKWDNGRGLALIIGEDQFQILPPEPQTIKFYMPLTAQLYAYDDWGDLEEYGNDLDGRELRDYQSCIHEALLENQMPEEKNRGLMHWYEKPDGVNTKVQSVMLDVESRDGQLWGVAECKVNGTLLPEEKEALAEYISGQASDGWGEGFEQQEIRTGDGVLYVHFWEEPFDFEVEAVHPAEPTKERPVSRRPKMALAGMDKNIFCILSKASDLLKRNGQAEQAGQMRRRVFQSGDYCRALGIISEYVETELSEKNLTKQKKRSDRER